MPVLKKTVLFLFIFMLVFSGNPSPVNQPDTLLRLHVKAHSDAPQDQALKYQVRDTVLVVLQQHLAEAGNADTARHEIFRILPEVLEAAQKTVEAAGYHYAVTATLGTATFPTRMYGDRIYRAGEYQALQIYLGDGRGQNWWCVLFPPLCFVETRTQSQHEVASVAAPVRPAMAPPKPKSRLVAWFSQLFSRK